MNRGWVATLSATTVAEIRRRYVDRGETSESIANDLGLQQSGVWRIATGRSRRDVPVLDLNRRVRRRAAVNGDEHYLRRCPELAKRGEDHPGAKLDEEQVLAIRARHAAGADVHALAEEYGVTAANITCHIVPRRTWRHI